MLIHKIFKIQDRTHQVVKHNEELLQLNNSISIHQRHLQSLAFKVLKSVLHLYLEFMSPYFNRNPFRCCLRKECKLFLQQVK